MKAILLVLTICLLTACNPRQVLPDPPKIELVKVPVRVECVGKLPIKPILITDAELSALKPGAFVTALHIDRLQRDAYMAELEAVIEGCK